MAPKRRASPSTESDFPVFASGAIEDRQSTFIAHYSPLASAKSLQAASDFKSASHRIAAWRKASTQRTLSGDKHIFSTGSDDDGEKYAGKRLERVLNDLQVEGAIVVARWYGGVLLGPVRFTHIETVAKEAIAAWKSSTGEGSIKKPRTEEPKVDEEAERKKVTKQLIDRDQSILVLRQLLAEKQTAAKTGVEGDKSSSQPASSPIPPMDYTKMPLQRLRQLEKARDASIAWILKQIDQVEASDKGTETNAVTAASDAAAG